MSFTVSMETPSTSTPSTPSAPGLDEINRVTTLDDLSQVDEGEFTDVYMQSLAAIHQYTNDDIQKKLGEFSQNVLCQLHSVLCDGVSSRHQQFCQRRIVKRTVIRTLVADIAIMGLCIVNGDISRELDKIFLEKLPGSGPLKIDDIYSKYVELLSQVSAYAERLEAVEMELRKLKAPDTPRDTGVRSAEGGADSASTQTVANELLLHNSGTAPVHGNNTQVIVDLCSDESKVSTASQMTVAPLPGTSAPAGGPITVNNQSATNANFSNNDGNVSVGSISRVTAASSKRSASGQTAEIYVGGTSGNVTCDDIRHDLARMKVNVNTSDVRLLSDKQDWRSFVVKVPKEKEQFICQHNNWAKELKVRPFRAPTPTGKSRAKPHPRPNQHQTGSRGQRGQRFQNRRQPFRPRLYDWCDSQQDDHSAHSRTFSRTYDWDQYRDWYDQEYPPVDQYRDWYDQEYPPIDRSIYRNDW